MASHQTDPPSDPGGPPAYPPASPEASPHKVKVYSMPPLAAQHSAMMRWRPAHGGCRADPEGARPTAAAPTQMMNIETIAALSRQPGWPCRLVPSRTAGGTRSPSFLRETSAYHLNADLWRRQRTSEFGESLQAFSMSLPVARIDSEPR